MSVTPEQAAAACDVCQAEAAHVSLMQLSDYQQIKVGLSCMPEFFSGLAADLGSAAPAAAPRPGEPAPAVSEQAPAPAGAGQDTGRGQAAAAPAPAPAQAPAAAGPPLDIVRQGDAEAAQLGLLRLLGIPRPDAHQCPQCTTTAHTVPGFAAYVCPYCATMFGDGWSRLIGERYSGLAASLVPDSPEGSALVEDTSVQETLQAENEAAADLHPDTGPRAPSDGTADVSRETSPDGAPF